MRTFDKNIEFKTGENPNQTPIRMPLITTEFMRDSGVRIKVGDEYRPFMKYWFTGEFSSQEEHDDFLKTLTK